MKTRIIKLKNPIRLIGISQLLYLVMCLGMFYFEITPDIYIIFMILGTWIFNLPSIISARNQDPEGIKWKDLNIISLINSLISGLICFVCLIYLEMGNPDPSWVAFLLPFVIGMIVSSIISIFLEKGPIKQKIKRLISVILFVWALYKIVTSFIDGESDEEPTSGGVDTDGDGVADSFDMDGDGEIDTSFIDTDGDGISDTIAMDTDGDGVIDTVYSDTDGDGKIDSFIKDRNSDGIVDSGFLDTDGDGRPDKLV